MTSVKQPLIILTGPTAVGKTALSIELAKAVGGEIISADSMQVYRHMDIGSAKVTKEEMEGIPHYLIDVLDPQDDFNVVTFQTMAKQAMNEIYSHNKVPIITGGTGFYIQALLYDIDFKENDEKNPVREELEQLAEKLGENAPQVLHQKLQEVDPEAAAQIHANNIKRVIRAIEYFKQTGEKISQHNEEMHQKDSPYNFLYYVLVDEVKKLKDMGCHRGQTSMQGLGYKEILDYLDGGCTLEEAVYILKRDTRHFAKRQLTWFRREKDVRWLDLDQYQGNTDLILADILKDCEQAEIVLK